MSGANGADDGTVILTDEFDPNRTELPGVRIAQLVATAADKEIDELEPLYYSIDTDALEILMEKNSAIEVKFEYEGFEVVIRQDKTIEILVLPP